MNKTLRIWLLVVMMSLVGVTFWSVDKITSTHGGGEGALFLEALPVDDIAVVRIKNADSDVVLVKKAGQWVVENQFGYRADFGKISSFVERLQNTRVGREFPIRDDVRDRLALNPPNRDNIENDKKGILVQLKNEAGHSISNLLFGKARQLGGTGFPDSRYVMFDRSERIYLVDSGFDDLKATPREWMDIPIIEAPAREIERIECYRPGLDNPAFVFMRSEIGGALMPSICPGNQSVDETVLKKMEWAISYLPLEDVLPLSVDPATIGLLDSIRLEYHLFNGMIYRVYPCAPCDAKTPCFVKIEVDLQKKPTGNESDKVAKLVRDLSDRLGPWVYKISEGHHSSLITDLEKLKALH